jgi:hypothetical protein
MFSSQVWSKIMKRSPTRARSSSYRRARSYGAESHRRWQNAILSGSKHQRERLRHVIFQLNFSRKSDPSKIVSTEMRPYRSGAGVQRLDQIGNDSAFGYAPIHTQILVAHIWDHLSAASHLDGILQAMAPLSREWFLIAATLTRFRLGKR